MIIWILRPWESIAASLIASSFSFFVNLIKKCFSLNMQLKCYSWWRGMYFMLFGCSFAFQLSNIRRDEGSCLLNFLFLGFNMSYEGKNLKCDISVIGEITMPEFFLTCYWVHYPNLGKYCFIYLFWGEVQMKYALILLIA